MAEKQLSIVICEWRPTAGFAPQHQQTGTDKEYCQECDSLPQEIADTLHWDSSALPAKVLNSQVSEAGELYRGANPKSRDVEAIESLKRLYEFDLRAFIRVMRVFLSDASEDRNQAEAIYLSLRGQGNTVFFDRADLPPGQEYDARIRRGIERSQLLVFLLSPYSLDAGSYTLTELDIAQKTWEHPTGKVLPVVVRPTHADDLGFRCAKDFRQ